MRLRDFARGVEILAKYEQASHCVSAEHDQVFIGIPSKTHQIMTEEERQELESIGWHVDELTDTWRANV